MTVSLTIVVIIFNHSCSIIRENIKRTTGRDAWSFLTWMICGVCSWWLLGDWNRASILRVRFLFVYQRLKPNFGWCSILLYCFRMSCGLMFLSLKLLLCVMPKVGCWTKTVVLVLWILDIFSVIFYWYDIVFLGMVPIFNFCELQFSFDWLSTRPWVMLSTLGIEFLVFS